MEEKSKKFPSIPSNYVTLQQLQERRLREQEQRQKEKEREEEEHRRELAEDRRQREEEEIERRRGEDRKSHEIERKQTIVGKVSGRWNPRKPRNLSGMERETEKKIGSDMQKGGGVDIGIAADGRLADEDQKPEESRPKKKRNRKRQQKKTMKWKCEAEPQSGVLVQLPAAKNGGQGENQIPVESKEENKPMRAKKKQEEEEEEDLGGIAEKEESDRGKKERITVGHDKNRVSKQWRSRGTANEKAGAAAARDSGVKKELVNVTATIQEIAIGDHHGQDEEKEKHGELTTLRAESEKHYERGYSRDRGRTWSYGRGGNTRVGGQMWIKKGENSESPMAMGSDSKR